MPLCRRRYCIPFKNSRAKMEAFRHSNPFQNGSATKKTFQRKTLYVGGTAVPLKYNRKLATKYPWIYRTYIVTVHIFLHNKHYRIHIVGYSLGPKSATYDYLAVICILLLPNHHMGHARWRLGDYLIGSGSGGSTSCYNAQFVQLFQSSHTRLRHISR